jgi:hypothetical protein
LILLLAGPALLVVMAFAWIAVAHGTPVLWNVVVHEGGHYTFGQTVLFVRHFLREVPVDIAMALSLAAAIRLAAPLPVPQPRLPYLGIAVAMVSAAFVLSAAGSSNHHAFE